MHVQLSINSTYIARSQRIKSCILSLTGKQYSPKWKIAERRVSSRGARFARRNFVKNKIKSELLLIPLKFRLNTLNDTMMVWLCYIPLYLNCNWHVSIRFWSLSAALTSTLSILPNISDVWVTSIVGWFGLVEEVMKHYKNLT